MAFQLIFTSSPVSLTTGRTGFSTVARTSGMPEKLAAAVERCSVYEIPSGAVYSHRILGVGSQKWHLLSRIRDAGTDYTNRNNFIAHHVLLSESEAASMRANAAEILGGWGGWLDSWDGAPRFVGPPEGMGEILNSMGLPAREWESVFGDAGKAALLASAPAKVRARASDAGELLKLYSESLQLFTDPARSWEISFTTHFNASENPRDFLWRAADSVEFSGGVDLVSRECPPAPDGRAAEYARTGEMNNREKFNLKVSGPDLGRRKFKVVDTPKRASSAAWKPMIAASCAVAAAGVAAVFAFFGTESEADSDGVARGASAISNPASPAPQAGGTARTLSETRDAVRGDIERCEFRRAISLWDASEHAKNDPSYRKKILSDIGYRADSLMDFSARVFSLPSASQEDYSKAIENVFKARRALDIPGVPRLDERMKTWKSLNEKIRK